MISDSTKEKIKELSYRYPRPESALMPALMLAQNENNNHLAKESIADVCKILNIPEAHAYGVATYYSMYNKKAVGKYHLQIDTNVPAMLMGAFEIVHHLEKKLGIKTGETTADGLITLHEVEDLGTCGTCPVIQVNDVYYENMTVEKADALIESLKKGIMPPREEQYNWHSECKVLLKNRAVPNAKEINVYRQNGGYKALEKARWMSPDNIIKEVKSSALRGRGGAGFPTGVKWSFVPKSSGLPSYLNNPSKPVYLICNADEGEPGTFKDRQIMEYDPHLLIEGMAIAAYGLGCKTAFIYIRGEFEWIARYLEEAVKEAKADGILQDLDIIVHRGAGAYVCGEETALIESLEGKRGMPRLKPPFPAVEGLYGCPTVVNNVETLASIPYIIEHGAEAYKKFGPTNNNGFKIYGVSGHINKPGVYEYEMGIGFNELMSACGGIKGNLKAAIVGGLSVPILKAEELQSLKLDYDSCMKHGTQLGSGGVIVINDTVSIPKVALRTIEFYAHESCGKCAPCRHGSESIRRLLQKIVGGEGTQKDITTILEICKNIKGVTICPTGEAFAVPISTMITKFRSEFDALVK